MSHDPQNEDLKRVRFHSLAPTEDGGCAILLEEVGGSRLLPIFAGLVEGQALAAHAAGVVFPRPLTHDLLAGAFPALGWTVARAVIHDVRDATFVARIDLQKGDERASLDARPSDAINVAARTKAPLFVAERVFAMCELVLKPIAEDEVARFKAELASTDVAKAFDELEGKPAPKE